MTQTWFSVNKNFLFPSPLLLCVFQWLHSLFSPIKHIHIFILLSEYFIEIAPHFFNTFSKLQRNTDINSSIKYHIFDIFATGEFLQESFQVNKVENYLKKIGYKIFVQQCFFQNIVRQTLFSPQIFCHQTFPYNAGQSQIIIKGTSRKFSICYKRTPSDT